MFNLISNNNSKKGIALFIAVLVAGVLLLIAVAISDISYKEQIITTSSKESKEAFYAADTGLECALFWDQIVGAFVGTGSTNITCAGETEAISPQIPPNTSGTTLEIKFGDNSPPNNSPFCFKIKVEKTYSGTGNTATRIVSSGYNNCNSSDPRRLERSLEANY